MDGIVTPEPLAARAESSTPAGRDSVWTAAAFGALGYMISDVLHEGLGHGGVAWLSGARKITVTSTYMEAGMDTRWILAAGTLVDLALGLLGLLVLGGLRRTSAVRVQWWGRLFVWAVTAFGLLSATGYFLFSGVAGIGDWAEWMKGLPLLWAWRVGFTLLGVVSYVAACRLLSLELAWIVGDASEGRIRRLMLAMYFAGGLTACLAGALNPMGWKLVVISAAASSFGGMAGLHNIPGITAKISRRMGNRAAVAALPMLPAVLVTAIVALAGFVWFLGPGVTLQ